MPSAQRILIASRDPDLVNRIRAEVSGTESTKTIVGIVDPTVSGSLRSWSRHADVMLIGAAELLWLRYVRPQETERMSLPHIVVVLEEHQLLDVVSRFGARFGLLILPEAVRRPCRIDLAVHGYLALLPETLERLLRDELRVDIARALSEEESLVLSCLADAASNRTIARITGIPEARVKTLVQSIVHRLHLRNRTAAAVFAATNKLGRGLG